MFSLRANVPAISKYVFKPVDPEFHDRAKEAKISFVTGGENFGQGSSREHSVLAPRYLGVRAIIARSFARIFKSNLVNFGILPLELGDGSGLADISMGDRILIEGIQEALSGKSEIVIKNLTRKKEFFCAIDLSSRFKEILMDGGLLAHIKKLA